jgi:hypothetical protein
MSFKTVLFIDLLYSENGSFDDDFNAIQEALPEVRCHHLKCNERNGFLGVILTARNVLSCRYEKVVILSSKVTQLAILAPLGLLKKIYTIYHFMPNSRRRLHTYLLPALSKFFSFATYTDAVSGILGEIVGFRPPVLPSRITNKTESERILREKFCSSSSELRVLVPGIRTGVRKFIEPEALVRQLRHATGIKKIQLFIQGDSVDTYAGNPNIKFINNGIPKNEYDALYRNCHVIAVEFDSSYEVRASGVILDAMANGCLVLTSAHAINSDYDFPHSIVCDIERIGMRISQIRSSASLQSLLPGANCKEFGHRWRRFLNLSPKRSNSDGI